MMIAGFKGQLGQFFFLEQVVDPSQLQAICSMCASFYPPVTRRATSQFTVYPPKLTQVGIFVKIFCELRPMNEFFMKRI